MLKFLKILFQILQHPESISSGISFDKEAIHHCLVRRIKDGSFELLSCTDHIPWWLSIVTPLVVNSDLGDKPVVLINELIGEVDPDVWIDKNEDKVIPKGFTANTIVNEYTVNGSQILSATITTRDRQEILEKIECLCNPVSLSIPLWDVGRMYWEHLQRSFVLWKVTNSGSILGYIENGMVIRLCNLWPDCSDLLDSPEESISAVVSVIDKITGDKVPVITFTSVEDFVFPQFKKQTGLNHIKAPDIKGVQPQNHEVFALACHKESSLNFVPFDKIQKCRKALNAWQSSLKWLRRGMYTVIVSIVLLAIITGSLRILNTRGNRNFSTVKMQVMQLKQATIKRDSLIEVFKKSGSFSENESAVTQLLSDLQVAIPDGLWTDEIDISADSTKQYRLDMVVFTKSSSLLGKFMSNMHSLKGVSDVRMVNSEQMETKKREKVIRFRVECVWSGR
jgi:hypothetical protein